MVLIGMMVVLTAWKAFIQDKNMKVYLEYVLGNFECSKCGIRAQASFIDILNVGTPVCSACDEEMELSSDEGEFLEAVKAPETPQDDLEISFGPVEVEEVITDPEAFERLDLGSIIGTRTRFHRRPANDLQDSALIRENEDRFLKDCEIYTVSHINHYKTNQAVNNSICLVEFPNISFDITRFEPLD